MRILYVEDNPANVFLVKRVAKMGNHSVINLIDGSETLKKFNEIKPDLVLMDIQLTGELSGLDVIQKLRERDKTIPVIAVTAYAMVGDKERCLEAGFDAYMAKPLQVSKLVKVLEDYAAQTDSASDTDADTNDTPDTSDETADATASQADETDTTTDTTVTSTADAPASPKVEEKTESAEVTDAPDSDDDNPPQTAPASASDESVTTTASDEDTPTTRVSSNNDEDTPSQPSAKTTTAATTDSQTETVSTDTEKEAST